MAKRKPLKPTKTKPLVKVIIIESERGWGQKIDEVHWFKTEAAADKFVTKHNVQNNEAVAKPRVGSRNIRSSARPHGSCGSSLRKSMPTVMAGPTGVSPSGPLKS